jgi:phage baseplate assembly protein gpV
VSRFEVGDRVVVATSITTEHGNRHGTVIEVFPGRQSPRGATTLDKCTVQFDDGTNFQFYDLQLMRVLPKADDLI